MRKFAFIFLMLIPSLTFALDASPSPFPVFLKPGFSCILQFDEIPRRVVVGNPQAFQIQRINHSLAIRTLVTSATSDMFVYFGSEPPRLFVLTASQDANPTFYKRFGALAEQIRAMKRAAAIHRPVHYWRGLRLLHLRFDREKDFLTIETLISADSRSELKPKWNQIAILYKHETIRPDKLWAERREIQRDSMVRARFIFKKPNLPRNLRTARLIIPLANLKSTLSVHL